MLSSIKSFSTDNEFGDILMIPKDVEEFFRRLAVANPEPQSELNFYNPYTLLISVLLSAQSTDIRVNKVTATLFQIADTPEAMLQLGLEKLKVHIRSIGLFNIKAHNIIMLSKILVCNYSSQVPSNRTALEGLPGVGRKTANVVLNIAFGQPTLAVDTHIFRVANRTDLASAKTPKKVEQVLLKVVPSHWLVHAHHWLVLHGRHICKARNPNCLSCLVSDLCTWHTLKQPPNKDLRF
jgi:endonuclease-3